MTRMLYGYMDRNLSWFICMLWQAGNCRDPGGNEQTKIAIYNDTMAYLNWKI